MKLLETLVSKTLMRLRGWRLSGFRHQWLPVPVRTGNHRPGFRK